jgi:hypothetical protein
MSPFARFSAPALLSISIVLLLAEEELVVSAVLRVVSSARRAVYAKSSIQKSSYSLTQLYRYHLCRKR